MQFLLYYIYALYFLKKDAKFKRALFRVYEFQLGHSATEASRNIYWIIQQVYYLKKRMLCIWWSVKKGIYIREDNEILFKMNSQNIFYFF